MFTNNHHNTTAQIVKLHKLDLSIKKINREQAAYKFRIQHYQNNMLSIRTHKDINNKEADGDTLGFYSYNSKLIAIEKPEITLFESGYI